MLDTYLAHTWHSGHALAGAKYAQYVHSMRLDARITGQTHRSCRVERTAPAPASVLTLAYATSAMIGRTG